MSNLSIATALILKSNQSQNSSERDLLRSEAWEVLTGQAAPCENEGDIYMSGSDYAVSSVNGVLSFSIPSEEIDETPDEFFPLDDTFPAETEAN